jgi:hypothetical protein
VKSSEDLHGAEKIRAFALERLHKVNSLLLPSSVAALL